jgi:protein PhnA
MSGIDWAEDALQTAYFSEEELAWAEAEDHAVAEKIEHLDAYGVLLEQGDTVFLTENLNVKGTNFTAAKGTKVAKIRLVHDNPEQIEGKIEGTLIVILTKFVRKGK